MKFLDTPFLAFYNAKKNMQCNSLNSYSNSNFCKNLWKKRANLFYSIISEMTIISLSMHLKKKTNDNCKKPEKLFQQRWNAHIITNLLIYSLYSQQKYDKHWSSRHLKCLSLPFPFLFTFSFLFVFKTSISLANRRNDESLSSISYTTPSEGSQDSGDLLSCVHTIVSGKEGTGRVILSVWLYVEWYEGWMDEWMPWGLLLIRDCCLLSIEHQALCETNKCTTGRQSLSLQLRLHNACMRHM